MKKTVLIVDDNYESANELFIYLNSLKSSFVVVGIASSGTEALSLTHSLKPSVMILNLIMQETDGFSVLRHIEKENMKIIALSELNHVHFALRAISLGADYFFVNPVSLENIKCCINSLLYDINTAYKNVVKIAKREPLSLTDIALEEKIYTILIGVGISKKMKCHNLVQEAVKKTVQEPNLIINLNTHLYPSVANRFDISPYRVKKFISHAIDTVWLNGRIKKLNSSFYMPSYKLSEKPTNRQFIAWIVEKILLER